MPEGSFTVAPDGDTRDIVFRVKPNTGDLPEDQLTLKDDIEKSLTVLRGLFSPGDPRFASYFRALLSLAQLGLAAEPAHPLLATRALVALKNEVVAREAGRIKNLYMKELGRVSLLLGLPLFSAAIITTALFPAHRMLSGFLALLAGCMAGVWLSFGARKVSLPFEELHIPEADRLEPLVRLLFAGFLTFAMGLLFSLGAITVTVGSVTTSLINESLRVALLVGLLCGFSEQLLATRVAKQASSFLDFG